MSLFISLCALFVAIFELHRQRRHDEKSLKPAPQIVLGDKSGHLFVQLQNNGVGPLFVEKLSFLKDSIEYGCIEECVTFDPKSYNHDTEVSLDTLKIIHPDRHIEIFGMVFEEHEGEQEISRVRNELADLQLKVTGRDTYDNEIITKRNLGWFARHAHRKAA